MAKVLILTCLALIVVSLGSALFHLLRNRGTGPATARALTWRISLSLVLFFALLAAGRLGLITPHGLQDGRTPAPRPVVPAPSDASG